MRLVKRMIVLLSAIGVCLLKPVNEELLRNVAADINRDPKCVKHGYDTEWRAKMSGRLPEYALDYGQLSIWFIPRRFTGPELGDPGKAWREAKPLLDKVKAKQPDSFAITSLIWDVTQTLNRRTSNRSFVITPEGSRQLVYWTKECRRLSDAEHAPLVQYMEVVAGLRKDMPNLDEVGAIDDYSWPMKAAFIPLDLSRTKQQRQKALPVLEKRYKDKDLAGLATYEWRLVIEGYKRLDAH